MSELNEIERGQLCQSTIAALYKTTGGLRSFPGLLKKIIDNKAWERRVSKGKVIELASLRELITEKPVRGWGEDPKKVEAVIKDDPECLAMFRAAMNGTLAESRRPTKEEQEINLGGTKVNAEDVAGTNAYWQARIQRDCPEELEAIYSGEKEIIDVRKERGWVSPSKRVSLRGEWELDAERLIAAFGESYLEEIKRWARG